MRPHKVVSAAEQLEVRKAFLAKEKELTRLRDQLSQECRQLPWVKVDKEYLFDGPDGQETLADLFAARGQLIVYHFMYHPSWKEGCPSCSFWADNFNGIIVHLNHRDVSMVAISKAPLKQLEAYKKRMDWRFKWLSSYDNDFNRDYNVSFTAEELAKGETYYNYKMGAFPSEEAPGVSVFYKDEHSDIFHTYSTYARGLDMLNGAYHYLDIVPKGRDEEGLPWTMAWLRRHDSYED
ncbi:MAG: thioredoxin family protein [Gammaproteobacteria bacterium]|nr:thioredoxin family protein [Gammaproteobacteria bacterium]